MCVCVCVCVCVYVCVCECLWKQAGKEICDLERPANSATLKFSKCTCPDPSEMVHMLPDTSLSTSLYEFASKHGEIRKHHLASLHILEISY